MYIIIIVLVILFFVMYTRLFKIPKIGTLSIITGGVKSGKSTLAIHMAIKTLRANRFKVKIVNFFRRLFKKDEIELPLLYSNIPIGIKEGYVPLTEDLLLRRKRFVYRSVVYIGEISLVAGSMDFKDIVASEEMLLFFKLCGHETLNGTIICDTQQVQDCHFARKRSLSDFLYIYDSKKFLFWVIIYCREMFWSDDGTMVNVADKDIEESLKRVIVSKRVWKYFDCFCYSILTDDLPIEKNLVHPTDLKARKIVSFKKYFRGEKK